MGALPWMLRQGIRNIRHGGLPFFFATLMTGLGLFALSAYAMVFFNFQNIAKRVQGSVGSVAFLDVSGAPGAEEARIRIARLPGVAKAQLVPPEVAMERVRKNLGASATLLEGADGIDIGWVVEVTPGVEQVDQSAALHQAIRIVPGVEEVMEPGGEMARIHAMLRLFTVSGAFLALLIVMVTLVVVSNTVKLTLYARREEIAIMKLVGATDSFVRVPFLIEGLAQGIVGAGLALIFVHLLHASLAGLIEVALSDAVLVFVLERLPLSANVWLFFGGAFLGLFGASISLGRYLKI